MKVPDEHTHAIGIGIVMQHVMRLQPDSTSAICCMSAAMRTSLLDIAMPDVCACLATFWWFMSIKPMVDIKAFHNSALVKPSAKMSAHCCFVLTHLMLMVPSCCTDSYSHARLKRCVLEIYRNGVSLPFHDDVCCRLVIFADCALQIVVVRTLVHVFLAWVATLGVASGSSSA